MLVTSLKMPFDFGVKMYSTTKSYQKQLGSCLPISILSLSIHRLVGVSRETFLRSPYVDKLYLFQRFSFRKFTEKIFACLSYILYCDA